MKHICTALLTTLQKFIHSRALFMGACCSIAAGTYFVHFPLLMSGGAACLGLYGLASGRLQHLIKDPAFWLISAPFWLMLLSLPYTTNLQEWVPESIRKLSFVLIALGISAGRMEIDKQAISLIGKVFLLVTIPVSILTVANYFSDMAFFNRKILESQGLPIVGGTSHITFSILCTLAIGLAIYFIRETREHERRIQRNLYILSFLILFVSFHIVASRTGWIALYSGLLSWTLFEAHRSGKLKWGIIILTGLACIPLLAWFIIPSFHFKILNTVEDIQRYFNGQYIGYYSVSMRFEAWRSCFGIFLEHPILGVGSADLSYAMVTHYDLMGTHHLARVSEAHNQLLEAAACNGIPGLISFLALWILPVKKGFHHGLQVFFWAGLLMALMFESFFEIQAGIAFSSLFYMLCYHWNRN